MAGDKSETEYPLSATDDAQIRKSKICVLGKAEAGGPLWVSSELVELEVFRPFVTMKMEMAAIERGKPAQVPVHSSRRRNLTGRQPSSCWAPSGYDRADQRFTAADKRVSFNVARRKEPDRAAQTLFCQMT